MRNFGRAGRLTFYPFTEEAKAYVTNWIEGSPACKADRIRGRKRNVAHLTAVDQDRNPADHSDRPSSYAKVEIS
jgi:hypothetical protein